MARSQSTPAKGAGPPAEGETVLVYTIADEHRPTYRRGILDTLSYPNGHMLEYSYRRTQVQEPFRDRYDQLTDRSGVVIFVDMNDKDEPTYCPLRRVTFLEPRHQSQTMKSEDPREKIIFPLLLGDFIEYSESANHREWHARLTGLDPKRQFEGGKPKLFVIVANDTFGHSRRAPLTAWENLVTALSSSTKLRGAVFLKLGHLRGVSALRPELDVQKIRKYWRGYELRPGGVYTLDLGIFEGPRAAGSGAPPTRVTLSSSCATLEINQPVQSVVSGLAQQSALLACKRTIEDTVAVLNVKVKEPVKGIVNTASPVFLLRISVARWVLILFLLFVFTGSLLISIDSKLVSELITTRSPGVDALLLKGLGSISLAAAAYLGFSKLPSARD